jgi:arsenate reductase
VEFCSLLWGFISSQLYNDLYLGFGRIVNVKMTGEHTSKLRVLFLCTGNSCRSQIAEGWARWLKGDVMDAYSAGVAPGRLNENAVKVMAEAGVDISMQAPKHINTVIDIDFDYVVTLCDNARRQCPAMAGKAKFIHRAFEDPTFLPGTEEEIMTAFRDLREQIKRFVEKMPECLLRPAEDGGEQKE